MTLDDFILRIQAFSGVVRLKGRHVPGSNVPRFDYALVKEQDSADLMFKDEYLGRVCWVTGGQVIFDPPLVIHARLGTFEEQLDEWVSLAHYRSVIRQGIFPENLNASNDE